MYSMHSSLQAPVWVDPSSDFIYALPVSANYCPLSNLSLLFRELEVITPCNANSLVRSYHACKSIEVSYCSSYSSQAETSCCPQPGNLIVFEARIAQFREAGAFRGWRWVSRIPLLS